MYYVIDTRILTNFIRLICSVTLYFNGLEDSKCNIIYDR